MFPSKIKHTEIQSPPTEAVRAKNIEPIRLTPDKKNQKNQSKGIPDIGPKQTLKKVKIEPLRQDINSKNSPTDPNLNSASMSMEALIYANQQSQSEPRSFPFDIIYDRATINNFQGEKTWAAQGIGSREGQEDRCSAYTFPRHPDNDNRVDFPHLNDQEIVNNLKKLFEKLQKVILALLPSTCMHAGSAAIICLRVNGKIYTANLGDCRAVLLGSNRSYTRLSADHKCSDPRERKRVSELMGMDEKKIFFPSETNGIDRLNGLLAMTRAFGDMMLSIHGLSTDPDVTVMPTAPGDKLVIASDGLWDRVHDSKLHKRFEPLKGLEGSQREKMPFNPATRLIRAARMYGSSDNATVIITTEENGLFMVFDGHGGWQVAEALNKHCVEIFTEVFKLRRKPELIFSTESFKTKMTKPEKTKTENLEPKKVKQTQPSHNSNSMESTHKDQQQSFIVPIELLQLATAIKRTPKPTATCNGHYNPHKW